MATFVAIRAHVESRLPRALTARVGLERDMVRTGIQPVDAQTGGIPKDALTQLCAPGQRSSGKTTPLSSTMAQLTNEGEFCATVDADDCFDPALADAVGVELSRTLSVRYRDKRGLCSLEQAFKATDILVQNGGSPQFAAVLPAFLTFANTGDVGTLMTYITHKRQSFDSHSISAVCAVRCVGGRVFFFVLCSACALAQGIIQTEKNTLGPLGLAEGECILCTIGVFTHAKDS